MIQLQFRISHINSDLVIVSDVLVDGQADDYELKVARAIEKVHRQILEKASQNVKGIQLDLTEDEAAGIIFKHITN